MTSIVVIPVQNPSVIYGLLELLVVGNLYVVMSHLVTVVILAISTANGMCNTNVENREE